MWRCRSSSRPECSGRAGRATAPNRRGSTVGARTWVWHAVRFEVRLGWQRAPFLLRKERIENVMRDERRVRAVYAVLEEHDAGDLGIVARREEHEPAVVAQVLGRLAGRRLPLVRDHLRRSRLT